MVKPNYIKLDLSEDTTMSLHDLTLSIKNMFDSTGNSFEPMDYNGLHMTLVFLGDILKKRGVMPINMTQFNNVLSDTPFCNKNLMLTSDKLCLFGRHKNLVVLTFECDKEFIKSIINYKSSFVQFGAKEERYFTPHITLGKIMYKKDDIDLSTICIPPIKIIVNSVTLV
jgi:2'-5' RNA ligase